MTYKTMIACCAVGLLAAACTGPLSSGVSGAGIAKTTNGGGDWVFMNKATVPSTAKKTVKQSTSPISTSNIFTLRFVPGNSKRIYAATQTHGLFYTDNAADSWSRLLDTFAAYDVAIDPTNSERLFVVGRADSRARVLMTSNGGKSWDEVYNDTAADTIARSIAMDPADPNTIAVGLTSGNVVVSRDGGKTWALVQNFQDQVTQLVWHANRTLYMLIRGKGVYVSADQGKTVQNISEPLLDFTKWKDRLQGLVPSIGTSPQTAVGSLDLPTQQTSIFYKLAVGENGRTLYVGANNGLFRTTDSGQTWQYMRLPLKDNQGTDVRGLALGPGGAAVYAGVSNTVYKTVNGGASWQVTAIATSATINYILVDPALDVVAYAGFIGTK